MIECKKKWRKYESGTGMGEPSRRIHENHNAVTMQVLRPNFKVGNLFFQILLTLRCRPYFDLPGLKVVS